MDRGGTKTWILDFPDSFTTFVYVFIRNLTLSLLRSRSPISSSSWETDPNHVIQCPGVHKSVTAPVSYHRRDPVPGVKAGNTGRNGINKESVKGNKENFRCNEKYNEN